MTSSDSLVVHSHRRGRRSAASSTRFVPPADWPSQGAVEFRGVSLRYRTGLEPALRNVSFQVKAGQRVGIVGRTGSGFVRMLQLASAR